MWFYEIYTLFIVIAKNFCDIHHGAEKLCHKNMVQSVIKFFNRLRIGNVIMVGSSRRIVENPLWSLFVLSIHPHSVPSKSWHNRVEINLKLMHKMKTYPFNKFFTCSHVMLKIVCLFPSMTSSPSTHSRLPLKSEVEVWCSYTEKVDQNWCN